MARKNKARAIGARIHRYVNQRREDHGLSKLRGSSKLLRYAESHSRTMAKTGDFSHNAGGSTPQSRCRGFRGVSENIYKTQDNGRSPSSIAGEAVKSWMSSQGHRKNILRGSSSIDGVGVWISSNQVHITHNFARRRGAFAAVRAAVESLPTLASRAVAQIRTAGNTALRMPYLPIRAIKSDWWRILPRHRQKSLTVGLLLGFLAGHILSADAILRSLQIMVTGGPAANIYRSVLGIFIISGLYVAWRQ